MAYSKSMIIITIPFSIFLFMFFLVTYPKYTKDNNIVLVLLVFVLVHYILEIPFRFLFPKKKIEALEYSQEEKKKYNRRILYFVLGFIILVFLRWVYVKYLN